MRTIFKKSLVLLMLALFIVPIFSPTMTYANGKDKNDTVFESSTSISDPGLPSASSGQIATHLEKKGFELVDILQRFGEPFMIIIFILGAFMFVGGLIAKGPASRSGIAMMLFSCICYAGVKYAPLIMDVFTKWIKS